MKTLEGRIWRERVFQRLVLQLDRRPRIQISAPQSLFNAAPRSTSNALIFSSFSILFNCPAAHSQAATTNERCASTNQKQALGSVSISITSLVSIGSHVYSDNSRNGEKNRRRLILAHDERDFDASHCPTQRCCARETGTREILAEEHGTRNRRKRSRVGDALVRHLPVRSARPEKTPSSSKTR